MRNIYIFLITILSVSLSSPAYAASWGQLKKGTCDATSGKRIYTAKLKRNFGDDPAESLCPRLHKTVNGKSRVPDKCEKNGITGYSGLWLENDATCDKKSARSESGRQTRQSPMKSS